MNIGKVSNYFIQVMQEKNNVKQRVHQYYIMYYIVICVRIDKRKWTQRQTIKTTTMAYGHAVVYVRFYFLFFSCPCLLFLPCFPL